VNGDVILTSLSPETEVNGQDQPTAEVLSLI